MTEDSKNELIEEIKSILEKGDVSFGRAFNKIIEVLEEHDDWLTELWHYTPEERAQRQNETKDDEAATTE